MRHNPKHLLVFNTHLDPWHPSNRKTQVDELVGFIEETLRSIEHQAAGDARAAEDGGDESSSSLPEHGDRHQQSQRCECEYDWSQTGVLVVGDFNIKAGSTEYRETLLGSCESSWLVPSAEAPSSPTRSDGRRRGWIDYFAADDESSSSSRNDNNNTNKDRQQQQHHHTYALQNTLVDYPEDCGRIDYVFGIQRFDRATTRVFLPLTVVSRSIRREPIGGESSDHYALVLELIPAVP